MDYPPNFIFPAVDNPGVNNLNRKIEENVAVGGQFGGVAGLWNQVSRKLVSRHCSLSRRGGVAPGTPAQLTSFLYAQYERVMAHSDNSEKATVPSSQPVSDAHDPGTTLADESYGLAPGAGSTSYMH